MAASADVRRALLREILGQVGDGAVVRPPFFCDYGYNIRLGEGVSMNFSCVILDVVQATIGSGTQIGPGVQIYAADYPRDPATRKSGAEFGRPVAIGENVWIGGAHHPAPRHDRRRRRHRGRCGRYTGCRERKDSRRQSGPASLIGDNGSRRRVHLIILGHRVIAITA
jgi:hypothetical protein